MVPGEYGGNVTEGGSEVRVVSVAIRALSWWTRGHPRTVLCKPRKMQLSAWAIGVGVHATP